MAQLPIQKLYIDGRLTDASGTETFETINPATGECLAQVQVATAADVERAVESAERGQRIWAAMTGTERGRILLNAVALLRERNAELALLESLDTGKPLSETTAVDIVTGADVLEYYAGLAAAIEGEQYPLRSGSFFYTRREPLGVTAGIGAWNYPIQIALWKSAPALAAGNAMIFKPSEITPLSALKLAAIYSEAGVPDGVFNVLQGSGSTGQALTVHPRIEKISFTGGVPTGKKVMAAAAESSLKEVTMELGGKSPLIILADADIGLAADIAMMANFYSSGQVCTNGTRVFVPRARKAELEAALFERVQRIRPGDPLEMSTNFGPLASFAHRDKVLGYIASGQREGARLLSGGAAITGGMYDAGAWVQPTIFTDCEDSHTIVREEIFGPVMSLLSYDSEQEAIQRANNTVYGLAAGVVTPDLAKAHQIIHQLEAGICWINSWGESPAQMPVGGYKQSGVGRENGLTALHHYTRIKSVQVSMERYQSIF